MQYIKLLSFITLIFFISCNKSKNKNDNLNHNPNDSITIWMKITKNKKNTINKRSKTIDKLYGAIAKSNLNDSITLKHLLDLSLLCSNNTFNNKFRKINNTALLIAKKVNDSTAQANLHWDAGTFYDKIHIRDSSFFHYKNAQQIFEAQKKDISSARMYMNMAKQQTDSKDYVASEINLIKALSILKPLNRYRSIHNCYNRLGLNFSSIGEYELALDYYSKAQDYEKKYKTKLGDKEAVLNNIALVYQKLKKHNEAIKKLSKIVLNTELKTERPFQYAKILGNLGLSKMQLGDSIESINLFNRAITIGDSIDNKDIVATNKIRLANYYLNKKDTFNTIYQAKSAMTIAKSANNFRDYLVALQLLSKVDLKNSVTYSQRYMKVNDSLHKEERKLRDKFARIRYETDAVLEENKELTGKVIRNALIGGLILVVALLFYFLLAQRAKNAKLSHERDQQTANQEIYSLMLAQQYKLEEGKSIEQQRISEELHDGVLGRLFGTRLSLGSLNSNSGESVEKEREKFIEEIKNIEEEIRNISHELHGEFETPESNFISLSTKLLETQAVVGKYKLKFLNDPEIDWEMVNGDIKINLYRILQEACKNCIKYAKASTFEVVFRKNEQQITVLIKDNGIGFNDKITKKGIGIKNMTSRSKKMNGTFSVTSKKGKGTSLKIEIPIVEA